MTSDYKALPGEFARKKDEMFKKLQQEKLNNACKKAKSMVQCMTLRDLENFAYDRLVDEIMAGKVR